MVTESVNSSAPVDPLYTLKVTEPPPIGTTISMLYHVADDIEYEVPVEVDDPPNFERPVNVTPFISQQIWFVASVVLNAFPIPNRTLKFDADAELRAIAARIFTLCVFFVAKSCSPKYE